MKEQSVNRVQEYLQTGSHSYYKNKLSLQCVIIAELM